jgi:hypothetical protein
MEEIKGNLKVLEVNKNENTTFQNRWYTTKAVLREKFIVHILKGQKDLK